MPPKKKKKPTGNKKKSPPASGSSGTNDTLQIKLVEIQNGSQPFSKKEFERRVKQRKHNKPQVQLSVNDTSVRLQYQNKKKKEAPVVTSFPLTEMEDVFLSKKEPRAIGFTARTKGTYTTVILMDSHKPEYYKRNRKQGAYDVISTAIEGQQATSLLGIFPTATKSKESVKSVKNKKNPSGKNKRDSAQSEKRDSTQSDKRDSIKSDRDSYISAKRDSVPEVNDSEKVIGKESSPSKSKKVNGKQSSPSKKVIGKESSPSTTEFQKGKKNTATASKQNQTCWKTISSTAVSTANKAMGCCKGTARAVTPSYCPATCHRCIM